MGAWIETHFGGSQEPPPRVAPYVGAWIETPVNDMVSKENPVAPYVGAWIETVVAYEKKIGRKSHPMWVRGLKRL